MANFTQLDQDSIESLAAEFSLGSVRAWKNIAAGTINSNYQVETSEGCFFLRVNEGKSASEVALEIAVLKHLVSKGIPSPLPKASSSGERFALWNDKFISVFDWVPGSQVDSQSISDAHCLSAGRALGDLHQAGKSMDLEQVGSGRYAHDKLLELYASFAESEDQQLADVIDLLREEFAWLAQCKDQRAAATRALIHADLFPDNVLVEGTEIVALIDFEQACQGSLIYDLAVAINAWCFADALVPSRVASFVQGYQAACPLTPEEIIALRVEVRAAALRFTITRICDVYLPAALAGTEVMGKDFRRFLMRLQTWQELPAAEFLRIADLALGTTRG